MKNYYEEILDYVNALQIIDSHEHLPGYEKNRERDTDILKEYLSQYFSSDLVSAGLKFSELEFARDEKQPLTERWKVVEPYWNLARNTGYGRALDLSVKALYGAGRIDGDTIEGLNREFLKTLEPGQNHYRKVLKEMSKIQYSVLDGDLDCDRTYFRSTCHLSVFVNPNTWDQIEWVEKESGIPITSFDDWLEACEILIGRALQMGAVALKCTLAYNRPLFFENTGRREAEECFNRMIPKKGRPGWEPGWADATKPFQDYMMHYILRIANRRGLICQIHTGLQEGNRNYIYNSDPSLLSNLFVQYQNVKFDLFHIGYPYQHVMSALGKMFPNVYLDMCWAHIISPAACIYTLEEWLDSVPVNKIIAFGGDYCEQNAGSKSAG